MGKRRIRNLRVNGEENIIGFDIRVDRRKEAEKKYNIQVIDDFITLCYVTYTLNPDSENKLQVVKLLLIGKH